MKKSFVILLTLLLISSFVCALDNASKPNLTALGKNVTGKVKEKTAGALEKEVTPHKYLSLMLRIKEDKIPLEDLIVLIILWIIAFMLIFLILGSFSGLESKVKSLPIAFILTSIASVSGGFYAVLTFYKKLQETFVMIANLGPFYLILFIIVIIIIYKVILRLSVSEKTKERMEESKEMGRLRQEASIEELAKRDTRRSMKGIIKKLMRRR